MRQRPHAAKEEEAEKAQEARRRPPKQSPPRAPGVTRYANLRQTALAHVYSLGFFLLFPGNTALHVACSKGSKPEVLALLHQGTIHINATNHQGEPTAMSCMHALRCSDPGFSRCFSLGFSKVKRLCIVPPVICR